MDFEPSEEQAAIRDLARDVLVRPEVDLAAAAQAGLLGAGIAEDMGGAGLGFVAVHLVLEEAGAQASSLPLWETIVLGALVVDRFGTAHQRRALLEPVVSGEHLLTAALLDEQPGDLGEPQTTAVPRQGGWELSGVRTLVPFAQQAHRIIVPARLEDGEVGLFLVDPAEDGVEVRPQEVLGGQPHGELLLAGAAVTDRLDGDGAHAWLLQHAQAGLASLTAGACRGALELSSAHVSSRQQFGRPLAAFQAVGQRLADAYVDTEAVRLAALQAAWRLEQGMPADDEVAIAAWWAAEAGHRVIHAAHHVHGGMGVDRSYPLPGYYSLVKQAELALGGAGTHLTRLGQALAEAP